MNSVLNSSTPLTTLRLGIDIGGTFTDFVIFNPATGRISTFKLPSTPQDPSEAVLEGIRILGNQEQITNQSSHHLVTELPIQLSIIHGSTVATNALLERKGAVTALITTSGFKDVIQIGRQNRPKLYNFAAAPVEPLIPVELRFELDERVAPNGKILLELAESQADELVAEIGRLTAAVESIAVCFLFSFANPTHEQTVTQKLRDAGYFVSASHEILPEYREFERTSTTVVNAYVSPVLDHYLSRLEIAFASASSRVGEPASQPVTASPVPQLPISSLQIMQSNGGSISVTEARKAGVRCILSGPAGGVVGCQYIGELSQRTGKTEGQNSKLQAANTPLRLLTFDMGGTSTDVSLIDGQPKITSEAEVGGFPIRVPLLDIHTIGAGGGSIASIDAGGALRVGPESAGANPGPACYGKLKHGARNALLATVTDANLLLGRIPAERFLGGKMPLYPELAEAALAPLAQKLGLSLTETALGIIEIANAHMERALRVISVESGHNPRDFTLLSFGGAGSLHAIDLARRLHIPSVLIPPYAATLSAFGMLATDVVKDYTQTVMLPDDTPLADLLFSISRLLARARAEIAAEGFVEERIHLEPALDMRYRGQSYELTIPFSENFADNFHEIHRQTYGYLRPGARLEIVNLRVRATGVVQPPQIAAHPLGNPDPSVALIEHHPVVLASNQKIVIPFYRGESLIPGNQIAGPAIIMRDDTTILIGLQDQARVDPYHNLHIRIGNRAGN